MQLIQEVKEDKKLTVFLEKRFKEYERDLTCLDSVQYLKDEIEVGQFLKYFFKIIILSNFSKTYTYLYQSLMLQKYSIP